MTPNATPNGLSQISALALVCRGAATSRGQHGQ